MKKLTRIAAFTLCAVVALSATACTAQKKTTEVASSSENVQIPNPWVDCKTIEDAEKLADFDFLLPETPDGCTIDNISAIENDIIPICTAWTMPRTFCRKRCYAACRMRRPSRAASTRKRGGEPEQRPSPGRKAAGTRRH